MVGEGTLVCLVAGKLVAERLVVLHSSFSSCWFSLQRGELTVSSPLFIVFLQRNKLRFHSVVGGTIDKAFWYLQKRHLWRKVALKKSPSTRSFTLRKLECFKQAVKRFLILLVDSLHAAIWEIAF